MALPSRGAQMLLNQLPTVEKLLPPVKLRAIERLAGRVPADAIDEEYLADD
jgi:hypothetical protein